MTHATSAQVRKLNGATPVEKLCRMLQSMLRRWPRARLLRPSAGIGVLLDDNTYMQVSFTGRWTAEDLRDCLALFATWCVADPDYIMRAGVDPNGVLQTARLESDSSVTRQG